MEHFFAHEALARAHRAAGDLNGGQRAARRVGQRLEVLTPDRFRRGVDAALDDGDLAIGDLLADHAAVRDTFDLPDPAVEAGERLGFLPGDLTEKVDPYMAPVWEALTQLMGADQLRRRRDKGEIEVAPIAFMRGRTLAHAFVIVDEAQNTSRLQMKMVLTRLGEGSRMVVTGDPTQVDLLRAADSGLAHAVDLLEGVEGVAVNRFTAADVVRHPLVERIVRAYEAQDQ